MWTRAERQRELARLRKSLEKAFAAPTLVIPKMKLVDGRLVAVEAKKQSCIH